MLWGLLIHSGIVGTKVLYTYTAQTAVPQLEVHRDGTNVEAQYWLYLFRGG